MGMMKSIDERLWAKVDRRGPDECWPFTGMTNEDGYGRIRRGTKHEGYTGAHRVAYGMDKIPEGLGVLHRCDNPLCCNPAHLFVGTMQDNMKDRDRKGRCQRGEQHVRAMLTEEQIKAIRVDERSHVATASDYGVTAQTIAKVRLRRLWKHV